MTLEREDLPHLERGASADVAHLLEVENSEGIRATLFEDKRRDPLSIVHLSLVHSWPSDLTATFSPPADAAPVQLTVREITYRERVVIPAVYFPGRTALRIVAVPFALAGDLVMLFATFGMWAHPANSMREQVREETDCGREAGSGNPGGLRPAPGSFFENPPLS